MFVPLYSKALLSNSPKNVKISCDLMCTMERSVAIWHDIIHDIYLRDGEELIVDNPDCKPDFGKLDTIENQAKGKRIFFCSI